MHNIIVLVMHGMPPRDFPKSEMAEYFRQYDPFHHVASHTDHHHGPSRFLELDEKMKRWPRNPENDLFYGAAFRLAKQLEATSGYPVLVGFNEFCAPDLPETLDEAACLIRLWADNITIPPVNMDLLEEEFQAWRRGDL